MDVDDCWPVGWMVDWYLWRMPPSEAFRPCRLRRRLVDEHMSGPLLQVYKMDLSDRVCVRCAGVEKFKDLRLWAELVGEPCINIISLAGTTLPIRIALVGWLVGYWSEASG